MNLKLLLYQTKFYLIYLLHEHFIPFSLTNFLFTIILIQYKHKLSNFPNNKLHFNNTNKIINNNRSKHPCKTNLPLLSPQKVRPLIHQILLNLKSSINLVTPSSNTSDRSTPHETKQQLTKRMQEAFVQMRTGGEPERLLGRYFPRFAGDQELFIVVYACVCVCVCRSQSLKIPEFSVFEKSTETTVTALVIRDSQETSPHMPLPLSSLPPP